MSPKGLAYFETMFPRGNTINYLVTCIVCNYLVVLAYITRKNYKYFMGSMGSTIFHSLYPIEKKSFFILCIRLKKSHGLEITSRLFTDFIHVKAM